MVVTAISDSILLAREVQITYAKKGTATPEELHKASKALYYIQVHHLVMHSWKQFRENLKMQAAAKNDSHRAKEKRKSEDEASRKIAQHRHSETTAAQRQAAKFRYFEGKHLAGESRHLARPV